MTKQDTAAGVSYAGIMPDPADVDRLIELASDISVHIDADAVVRGIYVNPENPTLGCLDHWVGRTFESFLTDESQEKFRQRFSEIGETPEGAIRSMELNHVDNAAWEFPVRYIPLRVAGGASLLLVGHDLQSVAEIQQRLIAEQFAREREQQKMRRSETLYRVVLEAADAPLVIVDPNSGRIRDVNTLAAGLLGADQEMLRGSAFSQAFGERRRDEMMEALRIASSKDGAGRIEGTVRRTGKAIAMIPEFFRAAGEIGLLCRLEGVADDAAAGGAVTESMSALFTASTDAIVILDNKGNIREANDAFLVLTDATQLPEISGTSFAEYLVRGEVDLRLLLDGTRREGRMRSYSGQFRSVLGIRTVVDISTALLRSRSGEPGFGMIIREVVQRELPSDDLSNMAVSEEAVKSVMDLVGTASLKELVSATSDVIERMCIETALQMTTNNRVAAAEMLGLSRQSLYVKLRKYNLVDGDPGK